jgi:hypothetical protein
MNARISIATVAAVLMLSAPALAAPSVSISIPVQLTNIDRAYDSLQINCQMQWSNPLGQVQYANMDPFVGKLAGRAYNGTAVVTYSGDPAAAQTATQAVCGLSLISSSNPAIDYRVGVDKPPAQYLPKAGAPMTSIVTVQFH